MININRPLLSREIRGGFHGNAIMKPLGELLEAKVREVNKKVYYSQFAQSHNLG